MVVVDSQFNDNDKRRIDDIGTVVDIDHVDECAYKLQFNDRCNWFNTLSFEKDRK